MSNYDQITCIRHLIDFMSLIKRMYFSLYGHSYFCFVYIHRPLSKCQVIIFYETAFPMFAYMHVYIEIFCFSLYKYRTLAMVAAQRQRDKESTKDAETGGKRGRKSISVISPASVAKVI